MPSPADCRFTDSHEWFRIDDDLITIGITQYAANELTDITWVEMQGVGTTIAVGDAVGEVESVKTTSDVYSPLGGEIVETNEAAVSNPALLNSDPFGEGWLIRIRHDGSGDMDSLLDQAAYDEKYPLD
ncbi:MAG: glycine cleavage system protein H [Phycisphaerae bacterium]|nr:glycine cleavage system protein H [Phycisphaerae bacterium]|tara:strand:- start:429 stop:812 length:384 start_codon:yes stop_codon:yes gene_type:complete